MNNFDRNTNNELTKKEHIHPRVDVRSLIVHCAGTIVKLATATQDA